MSPQPPRPVRFGVFEFDAPGRELRRQGVKLKLVGQPFEVLAFLLERPGELVTQEDFRRRLWSADTFVEFEHSLAAAVGQLRRTLGDSADNPRYVETVKGHGYRFIAPVITEKHEHKNLRRGVGIVGLLLAVILAGARLVSGGSHMERGVAPRKAPAFVAYQEGRQYLDRYEKTGNLDKAIECFKRAIEADERDALSFAALGEAYWEKYRLDNDAKWISLAEDAATKAAQLSEELPSVFVTLGFIHFGRGQPERALAEFQHALALDSTNANAKIGLAGAYSRMRRTSEAEQLYLDAAYSRPYYWYGFHVLGVFYLNQRQFEKALNQFRMAGQRIPDSAAPHVNIGLALQDLGRYDEAEAELKKALDLDPTRYRAHAMLGRLYYLRGQWAQAAATVDKSLELNSGDWRIWGILGLACEWLNQDERAAYAYGREQVLVEEGIKINPDSLELQSELALLYSKQQKRTEALTYALAALAKSQQKDPGILSDTAEVYENLGDRDRALEFVQKAFATGQTLDQLARNPGFRKLRLDPRFIAWQSSVRAALPRQ